MEITRIALARLAAFLEIDSLDPKGSRNIFENMKMLAERYQFNVKPETFADMDTEKGIRFGVGRLNEIAIDQIQIFTNGIVVDTRSSTSDCATVLQDLLLYAHELNGAKMISNRWHFVSQIVFTSELKISFLHPILQPIADRLGRDLSESLSLPLLFEPTGILIGPQTWGLKITPSPFSLERKAEAPFVDNTYYSAAPLGTHEHIQLLQYLEAEFSRPASSAK